MTPSHEIGAIVFNVSNLDRTIDFYGKLFGIELHKQVGKEGDHEERFAMGNVGAITLVFFEKTPHTGRSPVVVFHLPEGGIDRFTQNLASAGVTIVTPVSHAPGGWSSDFLDPDGHPLSYYQSADKPR